MDTTKIVLQQKVNDIHTKFNMRILYMYVHFKSGTSDVLLVNYSFDITNARAQAPAVLPMLKPFPKIAKNGQNNKKQEEVKHKVTLAKLYSYILGCSFSAFCSCYPLK